MRGRYPQEAVASLLRWPVLGWADCRVGVSHKQEEPEKQSSFLLMLCFSSRKRSCDQALQEQQLHLTL